MASVGPLRNTILFFLENDSMTWRLMLYLELLKTTARVVGLMMVLILLVSLVDQPNFSFRKWIYNCRVILYAWPIIAQVSFLLWGKMVEDQQWRVFLFSQGIASKELYSLVVKASLALAGVYGFYWWGGVQSHSTLWEFFPLHNPCEFVPERCGVPALLMFGMNGEIVERFFRIILFVGLPLLQCGVLWNDLCKQELLYAFAIGLFLVQEIVFTLLPL
jgi:hypothetical protein